MVVRRIMLVIGMLAMVTFLFIVGISCDTDNPILTNDKEGTLIDADGNIYHTLKIGNQEWMVENLRTTKYRDGSPIPFNTSINLPDNETPQYCYYNNTSNSDSIEKFGALYNWFVVDPTNPKSIAPVGWHVPTDAEWDTLQNYLINNGYNWDETTTENKIAKSMAAKEDWESSTKSGTIGNNLKLNNKSGFSALPVGFRDNHMGIFSGRGCVSLWWSATEHDEEVTARYAYSRQLSCDMQSFEKGTPNALCCFSIRLVRDIK